MDVSRFHKISLPMYNLPEMRPANQAFWNAIRDELEHLGVADTERDLDFARVPVPDAIEHDTLFTQVCGYPLNTIFSGQAHLLGAPVYAVAQCDGPTHVGVFLVHKDSPYEKLADLQGCNFAYNSRHSNSGMSLPRRAIADIAGGHPFFASVTETHSQPGNIARVAGGEADATCVDCVTYAFFQKHRPAIAGHTRVLAQTPRSPSIPFVTTIDAPKELKAKLTEALYSVARLPRWKKVRDDLMLLDIVPVTMDDYAIQLQIEQDAGRLGYPELR